MKQPFWKYGPAQSTVFLVGCSDLFEDNIVSTTWTNGVAIQCANSGGYNLGDNAVRNNSVRMSFFSTGAALGLDDFDCHRGNVFPGQNNPANAIFGGIHDTD
jgi:hypothetical protein